MNATEMKKYLVAFSKTLDNVDKDEFWGTARDEWNNIYPQFLAWYNSHHNRVVAKEHRQNKTLNLTLTVEEADLVIYFVERGLARLNEFSASPERVEELGIKGRSLIAKVQTTNPGLVVAAKERDKLQNKTLNLTLSVEEADFIITAIEQRLGSGKVHGKDYDRWRDLIGRIQQTEIYLRQHGIIQ